MMDIPDCFLAMGRGGLGDGYAWIVWREGNNFWYFTPSTDNFAQARECRVTSGSTEEVLAAALASVFEKRAPFQLTRRELHPGFYLPRIRRGELIDNQIAYGLPTLSIDEMNLREAFTSSVSAARILFRKMRAVFEVIEPIRSQATVYGHELRQLLILACTEVESAWRSILVANGYPLDSRSQIGTKDYVKLLKPMKLNNWRVRLLRSHEAWTLAPFEEWDEDKPTRSLPWYHGYNATKHDREMHLDCATMENVLHAMSAVFVMLVSQFGTENVLGAGLDDFVIEEIPTTDRRDAYIRSFRTDYGPSPAWRPMPLFGIVRT